MTTYEEGELLAHTGPGTPGGDLLRKYWQPVALCREIPQDGAPLPIMVMSEDLLLFRDDEGRLGLVQRLCPHRCADLSYGRIEDGGLRCLYHGWLFDVNGKCLETPAEPAESRIREKVKMVSYPVREAAGVVFAYMGGGEPPPLPDYEFLKIGDDHCWQSSMELECNWLQGLEGNIDPAHLSYLHRPLDGFDKRPVPGANKSADTYYAEERRPRLDIETTDFGVRIYSLRNSGEGGVYLRTTYFVMPNMAAIVGNEGRVGEGYAAHFHVPIDDHHHRRYDIVFNRTKPLDKKTYAEKFGNLNGPDGVTPRTKANRYLQDRQEMKTVNFTGMGPSFQIHDKFATESMGPISDKSREMLCTTDIAIVAARQQLLEGISVVQKGGTPRGAVTCEEDRDRSEIVVMSVVIPKSENYKTAWKKKCDPL